MKKRILSIVLALCMVLAFMPQMAFAETTSGITENGLKYTISDAGEVTITGYAGSPTTVEIPSSIEYKSVTYSVTAIGEKAFNDCKSLTTIKIPSSVTSIGGSAFNGCKNLEIIFLPDNNLSIESNAIPATASQVKYSLAEYKATITSASLGNGRTTLEIPSTIRDYPVSAINNSAFAACTSLESIFLPASLDDTNAGIPDTASRVKYSLDTDKDEVTIIEITLGTGRTSVDIPETTFDYPVVAVADGYQNLVGAHTHNLVNIPAKAPKYTEAGYKEHWQCTLCNKYFSDAAGTTEIADLENWKTNEGKIDKLTAPAPGKSDSVASDKEGNVSVTIEKSIVTVNGKTEVIVSESIANTILSKLASSSSKKVIINATTGKNTASKPVVTEHGTSMHVNLPGSAVKKLAEIENIEITLVTYNGKVVLDKETIAAVAAKADNNGQVTLVIETVEQNNNLLKVELKLHTSNGDVTDFNKGNVKVTVAISEVLKGKKPVCVYIDEDGRYHKIGGMLNADGTFTFVTGHFSTYAIMAEEEADTVIDAQQEEEILAALANQKLTARSKLVTMENGKKAVKITWYNKNGEMMDFDGVEIYRSTKKNSGYGKKPFYATKGSNTKGYYINTKDVKVGTTYYYRVRGYVIIDGQKHYTDYSLKAIRTVK